MAVPTAVSHIGFPLPRETVCVPHTAGRTGLVAGFALLGADPDPFPKRRPKRKVRALALTMAVERGRPEE